MACDISRATRPLPSMKGCIHSRRWWASGGGDDGFGFADIPVNPLEALQEAGQGAGTDGNMVPDLYVAPTQFAGYQSDFFLGGGVFNPQQILG